MYADWQMAEKVDQKDVLEEHVVEVLAKRGWTVTTAESCTGGLIAGTLVNVSGASEVLNEGYVTYSNEAKHSDQTAREMAEGAAKAAGADVAFASTGIAGPGGGTPEKPVGLIFVSCYIRGNVFVRECHFKGSRMENRLNTVQAVFQLFLDNCGENLAE